MLSTVAVSEFADKYSDHIVFASSAGTGTVVAQIWHVVPIEAAALIMAALFITLRVAIERWWHARKARKLAAAQSKRHGTQPKTRSRVHA